MPIFCVKSVKIYTGQKKFTRTSSVRPWQIWGMPWRHEARGWENPEIYPPKLLLITESWPEDPILGLTSWLWPSLVQNIIVTSLSAQPKVMLWLMGNWVSGSVSENKLIIWNDQLQQPFHLCVVLVLHTCNCEWQANNQQPYLPLSTRPAKVISISPLKTILSIFLESMMCT